MRPHSALPPKKTPFLETTNFQQDLQCLLKISFWGAEGLLMGSKLQTQRMVPVKMGEIGKSQIFMVLEGYFRISKT